ncbi:MAG: DNA recombination protein RmuC [bacterium]|nr:DNA recombination protein RmuC [bacterium]
MVYFLAQYSVISTNYQDMETVQIISITIIVVLFVAFLIVYNKLIKFQTRDDLDPQDRLAELLKKDISYVHTRLDTMNESLNNNLQKSLDASQKQHHFTSNIITDITERLTKLDETNRQVVGFADQLQSLENVLKNPKHRGVLGEYYLENVLKNVMPPSGYQMQYTFRDGDIVDAVVFVKDKIIPIDSKFSLENYNRIIEENDPGRKEELQKIFKADLKKRIDETSKYIKPEEGTMDFAFMFIPAEGIYYDLLINKVGTLKVNTHDLIEYAFSQKRVLIVSPTSFFAYLQTVLQGLRALKIEESAKLIKKQVEQLGRHLLSYEDYLSKMGKHLGTTVSMYNSSYTEFAKIEKDVIRISETTEGPKVEPLELNKPNMGE